MEGEKEETKGTLTSVGVVRARLETGLHDVLVSEGSVATYEGKDQRRRERRRTRETGDGERDAPKQERIEEEKG
jgi:hypothetical protein